MAEDALIPVAQENFDRPSRRLLKIWQDARLVRRMDEIIIASRGAYSDRSEFIAEAMRDRIEAEDERLTQGAGNEGDPTPPVSASATRPGICADATAATAAASESDILGGATLPLDVAFCDWLDGEVPTLPLASGPPTNFGLHNRDWPTLLAADWLGRITSERGESLGWTRFTDAVINWSWEYAPKLQKEDLDRPRGTKVAAGFPTNRKKREATEARFREHFLGTIDNRGNRGPLFVFGLVGLDGVGATLSNAGLALLRALHAAGIAGGPPFPPAAWWEFAGHLRAHAPEELASWMRVLAIVAEKPDRETLVGRCNWWKGATADTNSMSLIARAREWALVDPVLDEGHYRLTDLGVETLQAEQAERAIPG
jgi:hypothetical protein